jgi:hypothetical protein
VASTQHTRRHDRGANRLGLVVLSVATLAMFVWLVASLAQNAFGSSG